MGWMEHVMCICGMGNECNILVTKFGQKKLTWETREEMG